mgnify:CR=1 FL=1
MFSIPYAAQNITNATLAKVYKGIQELIGNTPLVEAVNLEKKLGLKATLLLKLEYFNPAGSVKDRIANGMIQETAQVADVQMKSIDQIRDGIRDMSQVVSDNSAMAEETSATSEELAAQSVTLNELVQKFELE